MSWLERLTALSVSGEPFVSVTVVETTGSVPAEAGAKMLVTAAGRDFGTVGGGLAEHEAIGLATAMLRNPAAPATRLVTRNLVKDLGMTCAGVVKLFFEVHNRGLWTVAVFGAGHVANALLAVLATLDCQVICVDPREEWLQRLPSSARIRRVQTADPAGAVAGLPDDAFVLAMTTDHETDLGVIAEALRTRTFPYVGAIGSKTKARQMREQLAAAGIDAAAIERVVCPIGLPLGSNQPSEIAISVAAQLLQRRDEWRASR